MSNDTTLAQRLEQAGSSAAQSWIITELLLNAYPATLRQAVLAAAVPHWFTADILAALLDLPAAQAQERYAALQQLSIVQPFGDLGYTLHDLTRSGILTYLASQATEEIRHYSQRVQPCFTVQAAAPDTQTEVESIYHQLIVDAAQGRAMLKQQARTYRGKGNFAAVENLLRNYRELIDLGLLENEDRAELERQKYWTAVALANRGKKENSDEGVHYLRKALEQFAPPEQLPTLLADEPTQWREQIDTYKRDFVHNQVETARSASDLALQPFWLAELGDLYRDEGNLEASLQQLDEALTLAPENARAWAYRGETKRQMKQYEEALTDLDRAIALDEKYTWAINRRGDTYRQMEQYEEALENYTQTISLDEKSTWAFAFRGETYRLMKRYEEALADFDRAIALDEKYAWAISHRGETYRFMKRYEEALVDFDRVIQLNDKNAWAIAVRGAIYRLMDRYEAALANFDRAIELDSTMVWVIVSRGQVYMWIGEYEEGLADLGRAIELNSEQTEAYFARGEIYLLFEQYDKALTDFNWIIQRNEEQAWAIGRRSLIYRKLGRLSDAWAEVELALQVEEGEKETDWYLYCRGLLYLMEGKLELAIQDFNCAIDIADSIYSEDRKIRANCFNLMLYSLVAKREVKVEQLLAEILENVEIIHFFRMGIFLVSDLLTVVPDHTQAITVLRRLQTQAQLIINKKGGSPASAMI